MLRQLAGVSLLITMSLAVATAQGRSPRAVNLRSRITPATVAITYNAERAKTVSSGCNCFWFQGAAADATWPVWNHLGIAAQLSGAHASSIGPGVDISKIDFLFGPRYTWQPVSWKHNRYRPSIFGEFLLGGVHAFNTVIPTTTGTAGSATSFGFQAGAGANLWLTRRFGIRLLQLDYVYSQLPNAGNSTQNDFRIATGVIWRLP